MEFEMGEETRTVPTTWDVSANTYKIDGRGLRILTEAMKEKKFRGVRCHECGTVYMPAPFYCRKCFVEIDDIVDIADTGVVTSFAVEMADIRGNPLEEMRIAVMIQLDGCDSWFVGTLKGIDWKDVKIGMRVKAVWVDNPQGTLGDADHFVPA